MTGRTQGAVNHSDTLLVGTYRPPQKRSKATTLVLVCFALLCFAWGRRKDGIMRCPKDRTTTLLPVHSLLVFRSKKKNENADGFNIIRRAQKTKIPPNSSMMSLFRTRHGGGSMKRHRCSLRWSVKKVFLIRARPLADSCTVLVLITSQRTGTWLKKHAK